MMSIYERFYAKISEIPPGKVAYYGQIARLCGYIRGARIVGWALRPLPSDSQVPWWRVINKQGMISITNPRVPASIQKELLEKEGVKVREENGAFIVVDPPWYEFPETPLV